MEQFTTIQKSGVAYLVDIETDIVHFYHPIKKPEDKRKTDGIVYFKDLFGKTAKESLQKKPNPNNKPKEENKQQIKKQQTKSTTEKAQKQKEKKPKDQKQKKKRNRKNKNKIYITVFNNSTIFHENSVEAFLCKKAKEFPNAQPKKIKIVCTFENIIDKNSLEKSSYFHLNYRDHLVFYDIKEGDSLNSYRNPLFPKILDILIPELSKYVDFLIVPSNEIFLEYFGKESYENIYVLQMANEEALKKYIEKMKNKQDKYKSSKYIYNIEKKCDQIIQSQNQFKEKYPNMKFIELSEPNFDLLQL